MAIYKSKRGKKEGYDYPRNRYSNNSPDYNHEYYEANKSELRRRKIRRQLNERLDKEFAGSSIR